MKFYINFSKTFLGKWGRGWKVTRDKDVESWGGTGRAANREGAGRGGGHYVERAG